MERERPQEQPPGWAPSSLLSGAWGARCEKPQEQPQPHAEVRETALQRPARDELAEAKPIPPPAQGIVEKTEPPPPVATPEIPSDPDPPPVEQIIRYTIGFPPPSSGGVPSEDYYSMDLEIPPPETLFALTGLTIDDVRLCSKGQRNVTEDQYAQLEALFTPREWRLWFWKLACFRPWRK